MILTEGRYAALEFRITRLFLIPFYKSDARFSHTWLIVRAVKEVDEKASIDLLCCKRQRVDESRCDLEIKKFIVVDSINAPVGRVV